MPSLILALVLLFLAPLSVRAQDVCTTTASAVWSAATTISNISCTGGNNVFDGVVDSIVANHTLQIINAVDGQAAAITVGAAGNLIMQPGTSIGLGNTAGGDLTGSGALTMLGAVMDNINTAAPTFSASGQAALPDPNQYLFVGDVVHCPSTADATVQDCAAAAGGELYEMAICWPPDRYADTSGNGNEECLDGGGDRTGCRFWGEAVTLADPNDWIAFFDPDGKTPPADFNSHYQIVRTDDTNGCIVLDLRQGCNSLRDATNCPHASASETGNDGYSLTEREIGLATIANDEEEGARLIEVGATEVLAQTGTSAGGTRKGFRWLTCPDRNGVYPGPQSLVLESDGTADTYLLDPLGLRTDVPSTTECFIDYGWKRGDPFFIYRPAVLYNVNNGSQANRESSHVDVTGSVSLWYAHFEALGRAAGGSTIDFDGSPDLQGAFVVARDISQNNAGFQMSINGAAGRTLTGFALSGSDPDDAIEPHGWCLSDDNGTNNSVTIDGFHARHVADDAFNPGTDSNCGASSDGDRVGTLITRFRCSGFAGGRVVPSMSCIDNNSDGASATVIDLLVQDGVPRDIASGAIAASPLATDPGDPSTGRIDARNVVSIANDSGRIAVYNASLGNTVYVSNLYSLRNYAADAGQLSILPYEIFDSTFEELIITGTPTFSQIGNAVTDKMARLLFLRTEQRVPDTGVNKGLVQYPIAGYSAALRTGSLFEDVAIIDTKATFTTGAQSHAALTCANAPFVAASVDASTQRFTRATVGWQHGADVAGGHASFHHAVDIVGSTCGYDLGGDDPDDQIILEHAWIFGFASDSASADPAAIDVFANDTTPNGQDDALFGDIGDERICLNNNLQTLGAGFFTDPKFLGQDGSVVNEPVRVMSNFEPAYGSRTRAAGCGARNVGAKPGMYFMKALGWDLDETGSTGKAGAGGARGLQRHY